MTRGGDEHFNFTPDHLRDPTSATRDAFEATIQGLVKRHANRTTVLGCDFIDGWAGDTKDHYVHFYARTEQWDVPPKKPARRAHLHVTFGTDLDSSTRREFNDGLIEGDMTDDEYTAAVDFLGRIVLPSDWAWIQKARLFASQEHNNTSLLSAVKELLDTPPSEPPVCSGREYFLEDLVFNDGLHLQMDWIIANPAYLRQLGSGITRQVTITPPTGELYNYASFTDGTEQMFIEADNETIRTALAAQGFTDIDTNDYSAAVTPEMRRMGVQAPSDALMGRFCSLLDNALTSGVRRT